MTYDNIGVFFHMVNHYKRLKNVKPVVDCWCSKGCNRKQESKLLEVQLSNCCKIPQIPISSNKTCCSPACPTNFRQCPEYQANTPKTNGLDEPPKISPNKEAQKKDESPKPLKTDRTTAKVKRSHEKKTDKPTTEKSSADKASTERNTTKQSVDRERQSSPQKQAERYTSPQKQTERHSSPQKQTERHSSPQKERPTSEKYAEKRNAEKRGAEKSASHKPRGRPTSPTKKETSKSEPEEHEYVHFLLKITEDILRNNIYTDKEIDCLIEHHIEANKGRLNEDKMRERVAILKQELDLPLKRACMCAETETEQSDCDFVISKTMMTEPTSDASCFVASVSRYDNCDFDSYQSDEKEEMCYCTDDDEDDGVLEEPSTTETNTTAHCVQISVLCADMQSKGSSSVDLESGETNMYENCIEPAKCSGPRNNKARSIVKIMSQDPDLKEEMILYCPRGADRPCNCNASVQKAALKIQTDDDNEEYILVDGPVCMPRTMLETKTIAVLIQNASDLEDNANGTRSCSRLNFFLSQEQLGQLEEGVAFDVVPGKEKRLSRSISDNVPVHKKDVSTTVSVKETVCSSKMEELACSLTECNYIECNIDVREETVSIYETGKDEFNTEIYTKDPDAVASKCKASYESCRPDKCPNRKKERKKRKEKASKDSGKNDKKESIFIVDRNVQKCCNLYDVYSLDSNKDPEEPASRHVSDCANKYHYLLIDAATNTSDEPPEKEAKGAAMQDYVANLSCTFAPIPSQDQAIAQDGSKKNEESKCKAACPSKEICQTNESMCKRKSQLKQHQSSPSITPMGGSSPAVKLNVAIMPLRPANEGFNMQCCVTSDVPIQTTLENCEEMDKK